MARYYFDIHDGAQSVRDDEGAEFDSLDAAVQAATRSAAEIGTGRLAWAEGLDHRRTPGGDAGDAGRPTGIIQNTRGEGGKRR